MIKSILQLIRWPNLLMLGGIQALVYFTLLDYHRSSLSVSEMVWLVIITMLVGGAGYVINDYYDHDIDRINKPTGWIAGSIMPLRAVLRLYFILVSIAFILSLILAIRAELVNLLILFPLATAALWYYSYKLKCRPVAGNIWVSFFCAGVIGILALPDLVSDTVSGIRIEFWYFLLFAFLSTWYREIVKDMEDMEGDARNDCQTVVVRFGINAGKIMATIIGLALVGGMLFWDSQQDNHWIDLMLVVLEGFTVGSLALIWWAKNSQYYHHASTLIKFIMAAGTLLLLLL
jgi:4-hydroxybenzoate polyprenyltransferase